MRKSELVGKIKDALGIEFLDRTVALHIADVFNTVVGQLFSRNPNQWEFYSKEVTLTVDNRVCTLDIPLVQTPFNANGVPRIQPTGASCLCVPDKTVFYPAPAYGLTSSVDAADIAGMYFYVVKANTIKFSDNLPLGVTEVLATVVPEFQGFADDDFINLPAGVAQMIVDGAVAAVRGTPAGGNIYKPKT